MVEYDEYIELINFLVDKKRASFKAVAESFSSSIVDTQRKLKRLAEIGAPFYVCETGVQLKDSQFLDVLSREVIVKNISARTSANIYLLLDTDSTNKYLRQIKFTQEAENIIAIAEYQSSGVGRRGKRWVSPFGTNIYFSLRTTICKPIGEIGSISLVVGMAVIKTLTNLKVEHLMLKWPNDVYCDGKKLSGILIEVVRQHKNYIDLIIGIGINVSMGKGEAEEIDQKWTDIASIKKNIPVARSEIIFTLINTLIEYIKQYEQIGFSSFIREWCEVDFLYGKPVVVTTSDGGKKYGVAAGVSTKGELIMQQDGETFTVSSGEVSVRVHNA